MTEGISAGTPAPASSGSTTNSSGSGNESVKTGIAPTSNGTNTNLKTSFNKTASVTSPATGGASTKTKAPEAGATETATEAPEPAPWSLSGELDVYGNKVKVNYGSQEEVLRELQRGRGALTKLEKAAALEKETREFVQYLKSNPAEALAAMGIDFKAAATQTLAREAQEALMTEEQKAAAKYQREAQTYKQQLEQIQAEQHRVAQEQYEQKVWSDIEPRIMKAAESRGLARHPTTFEDIALIGKKWTDSDMEFSPEMLIDAVNEKHETIFHNKWGGIRTNPAAVAKLLGEDGLANLNKWQTEKYRSTKSFAPKPNDPPPAPKQEEPYNPPDEYEWKKKFNGGR